jgi:prepilin-type N-terminal cleavage/methylation domain-containing protein
MISSGRPKDAGFTLVELLVVLAILGLLGGLLAAGLRSASEGWQRIVRYNDDSEELLAINSMLRQLLLQIYPQRVGDSSRSFMRFNGYRDRMEFLAPLAQRFGTADIVWYTMRFQGDGTLRIAWRLDRRPEFGQEKFSPAPAEELLHGFPGGSLSYFGPASDGGESRWWDTWQERRRLPLLLRIRFVWRGGPEELIVAPRLTGGSCVVNGADAPCSD